MWTVVSVFFFFVLITKDYGTGTMTDGKNYESVEDAKLKHIVV